MQKKSQEDKYKEEKTGMMSDYNIFMAMIDKIGHDKRGNPLFKRDKDGNEILIPDTNNTLVMDSTSSGEKTVSMQQKTKVEDDDTPEIPPIFREWKIKEGISW